MTIKMIAMGGWGRGTYLADSWNRLDFFIVMSGALEYFLQVENLNLTAIRTIRVLRPLRAINRIPSKLITHYSRVWQFSSLIIILSFFLRYEDTGDVVVGYIAYARKRSSLVLFCFFHFWHHWSSVMGRYIASALRFAIARCRFEARVSTYACVL